MVCISEPSFSPAQIFYITVSQHFLHRKTPAMLRRSRLQESCKRVCCPRRSQKFVETTGPYILLWPHTFPNPRINSACTQTCIDSAQNQNRRNHHHSLQRTFYTGIWFKDSSLGSLHTTTSNNFHWSLGCCMFSAAGLSACISPAKSWQYSYQGEVTAAWLAVPCRHAALPIGKCQKAWKSSFPTTICSLWKVSQLFFIPLIGRTHRRKTFEICLEGSRKRQTDHSLDHLHGLPRMLPREWRAQEQIVRPVPTVGGASWWESRSGLSHSFQAPAVILTTSSAHPQLNGATLPRASMVAALFLPWAGTGQQPSRTPKL